MTPSDLVLPGLPSGPRDAIYHFSENPDIKVFRPRRSRPLPGYPEGRDVVWGIDEYHAPLYLFPRECPRIVLWALERSTRSDIDRWIGPSQPRMAAFIEKRWFPTLLSCRLYRYTFDPTAFVDTGDHGTHVSTSTVKPASVEPVGPLLDQREEAGVRFESVESLQIMAGSVDSSLHFSGVRLGNAATWRPPPQHDSANRGNWRPPPANPVG